MIIIDDLLLAPIHGIIWIFRELHETVKAEMAAEEKSLTAQLSELYMMLETGKISETEFDEQEKVLLDRLDAIEKRNNTSEDTDDT